MKRKPVNEGSNKPCVQQFMELLTIEEVNHLGCLPFFNLIRNNLFINNKTHTHMKKYLSIETIYKIFVVLAVSVIVFALNSEVFASNDNPADQPENKIWTNSDDFEIYQFQEAQFLTRINSPKLVQEFLFLCDNSIYIPTITNWNKFVKNYTRFYDAYRAYKQGFSVEFDNILN